MHFSSKDLHTLSSLLVNFNPNLRLTLTCDALAYGIGIVLAHKYPDGLELLIGYASHFGPKQKRITAKLKKKVLHAI